MALRTPPVAFSMGAPTRVLRTDAGRHQHAATRAAFPPAGCAAACCPRRVHPLLLNAAVPSQGGKTPLDMADTPDMRALLRNPPPLNATANACKRAREEAIDAMTAGLTTEELEALLNRRKLRAA